MLCDADAWTRRILQVVLGHAGFHVHATRTAAEALDYAALHPPDIAITETWLPDSEGVELCRRLRAGRRPTVLVLSSVTAEQEKVRALDAGADDYLTKPVRANELIARLHAILRRAKLRERSFQLQLNGLTFDSRARVVYRDGAEVHLTPTEFDLLQALANNAGSSLSLTELAQQTGRAPNQPHHSTLCGHLSNLRHKLTSAAQFPPIHTDRGIGYQLERVPGDALHPGWLNPGVQNPEAIH
jgi:two-component system, OmpR family, KDP operon response regulator KdpE